MVYLTITGDERGLGEVFGGGRGSCVKRMDLTGCNEKGLRRGRSGSSSRQWRPYGDISL